MARRVRRSELREVHFPVQATVGKVKLSLTLSATLSADWMANYVQERIDAGDGTLIAAVVEERERVEREPYSITEDGGTTQGKELPGGAGSKPQAAQGRGGGGGKRSIDPAEWTREELETGLSLPVRPAGKRGAKTQPEIQAEAARTWEQQGKPDLWRS